MAGGVYLASLISKQTGELKRKRTMKPHHIILAWLGKPQNQAFNMVKNKAVQILSTVVMQAIGEIYEDVDVWLRTPRSSRLAERQSTSA